MKIWEESLQQFVPLTQDELEQIVLANRLRENYEREIEEIGIEDMYR